MTFAVPLQPNMEFGLFEQRSAAISAIPLYPKIAYVPSPHPRVPDTFRSCTKCQVEKTKVLSPESNTGSANYALAVLSI